MPFDRTPDEHLFAANGHGEPTACCCGHRGDLIQHAREVLPHVNTTQERS